VQTPVGKSLCHFVAGKNVPPKMPAQNRIEVKSNCRQIHYMAQDKKPSRRNSPCASAQPFGWQPFGFRFFAIRMGFAN
jgi:hypothetical protein